MAIIANTTTTFDIKGIREELSNIIYNIAPEDTLALHALRCGLRGSTLKRAWLAKRGDSPGRSG